uniref:Odorant-binding protein 16 n=1 Tax=Encarsia formosa TaxID=32400 RepID=A0A514TTX6_ENCFO|nr:odorant-binding protein 16 [Encarsia formosa]
MKFFVLTLSVLFFEMIFAASPDTKFIDECLKEINIPSDVRNPVVNVNDPKQKCFKACIMKKIGTLKNGKIDPTTTFEIMKNKVNGNLSSLKEKINECAKKANQKKR